MRSRPSSQISSPAPSVLTFCCVAALLCSFLVLPAAAAGTGTRISFGDGSQDDPRISGNSIVWVEKTTDYDIVLYDIASGTPTVFNGGTMQNYAKIDGDYVVWEGDRYNGGSQSHNYDIYLLHIPTKSVTRLNNDQWDFQYYPDISGDRVVWVDDRNRYPSSQWDIYLYQISSQTETRITTDTWDESRPAISGNYVVMEDFKIGAANISLYDISTGLLSPLVTAADFQERPRIDGNYVVYQDYRNGHWDIYLIDLSTREETRITSHASGAYTPEIDGDRIVWTDDRNGNNDIYLYNITSGTETRITTDPYNQAAPDISGNRIVWMDNRDGDHNLYAVYMYSLEEVTVPTQPYAEFISDVRTGTAPLTVHFTDRTTGTGPFTYSWDFQNDGREDSTLKDPTFIYTTAGTSTVKLTVTGPGGTNSETKDDYITVNPAPTPPPAPETLVVTSSTSTTSTYLGYSSSYVKQAQSMKAADSGISRVAFALARKGTPALNLTVRVRTTLNGPDLATATITPSMVTSMDSSSPSWVEVPIGKEGILTSGGTVYVILDAGTYDLKNYYYVPLNSGNPYSDGIHYRGTTFYPNSGSDMLVKVWFTGGSG
jgi:beta propeller repeat protein